MVRYFSFGSFLIFSTASSRSKPSLLMTSFSKLINFSNPAGSFLIAAEPISRWVSFVSCVMLSGNCFNLVQLLRFRYSRFFKLPISFGIDAR